MWRGSPVPETFVDIEADRLRRTAARSSSMVDAALRRSSHWLGCARKDRVPYPFETGVKYWQVLWLLAVSYHSCVVLCEAGDMTIRVEQCENLCMAIKRHG
jgi:hypothetical protein